MIVPDVNILVYALQPQSVRHQAYKDWLDAAIARDEPIALDDSVTTGFLRLATNSRVFDEPESIEAALAVLASVATRPIVLRLESSPNRWSIFEQLCGTVGATGSDIPDAYLAAACIDAGATLITADTGFGRFPGLRWRHPLDG